MCYLLSLLTFGNMTLLTASLKSLFRSVMLPWPAAKCEHTKHSEVEWYLSERKKGGLAVLQSIFLKI